MYSSPKSNHLDAEFFRALERQKLSLPVLPVGGHFAMGPSEAGSARRVASRGTQTVLEQSAHYPAEEDPA